MEIYTALGCHPVLSSGAVWLKPLRVRTQGIAPDSMGPQRLVDGWTKFYTFSTAGSIATVKRQLPQLISSLRNVQATCFKFQNIHISMVNEA